MGSFIQGTGASIAGGSFIGQPPGSIFSAPNSTLFTSAGTQYVDLGNTAQFQPNQAFSVCGWVYIVGNANSTLISTFNSPVVDNFFGYALWTNSLGTAMQFSFRDGHNNIVVHANGIAPNGWYFIVITYDGSNSTSGMHILVNAVDQTTNPVGTSLNPIVYNGSTKIAGDGITGYTDGYIAEVSIWNTNLSSGQVSALYNNGQPTNLAGSPNLLHWYRMGNAATDSSSTIYDQVGTANGTMTNSPVTKTFAPFSMQSLGSSSFGVYPAAFLIDSGKIYQTDYHSNTDQSAPFKANDLNVYSLTAPATIALLGSLATQYPTHGPGPISFLKTGTYVYAVYYKDSEPDFLKVVDVSNAASPSVLATVSDATINAQFSSSIAKSGNYLYVPTTKTADGTGYLEIINISNPASPSLTNTISTSPISTPGQNAAISGNYLYIVGINPKGLQIYDISGANITNPLLKSTLTTTAAKPNSITLDPGGTYAYLTEWTSGTTGSLEVVNISNPASPSIVATMSVPWTPMMSVVHPTRKLLFIPSFDSGEIEVFSVYDPTNLFLVTTLSLGNGPHSILKNPQWLQIIGDYLYCSSNESTGISEQGYGYLDVYQL